MIADLKDSIISAVKKAGYDAPAGFELEAPPNDEMGDFSTNVAMTVAGKNGGDPKGIADKIIKNIDFLDLEKAEIAGPGFINIKLNDGFFHQVLISILKVGSDFGKSNEGRGKKVLVEYISANPTGPLHIGNARGGPIGEALSNVLSWLGYEVEREFYINDSGSQIDKFGRTLAYYFIVKKDPDFHFPEDGYPGEFLKKISEEIQREHKTEIEALKDNELTEFFIRYGLDLTIRRIKNDVETLGAHFDRYIYESDFLSSGASQKVVEKLQENGKTSEKEGAIWFSSPENSDLSDRECVLVRSDAEKTPTYFSTDIAYHKDKFDRGNQLLIDIWGPNHHGHIARLKAALQALGYNPEKLEILLYQNVKLKSDGKAKQMGKRLGNFVNIADLVGKMKVPADVFKYMVISQNMSSIIEFDLDLALLQSEKNPVYYLQYAYARICSVLRKVQTETLDEVEKIARGEVSVKEEELKVLTDKKELKLIKTLLQLPLVLQKTTGDFQIQTLPHFTTGVAKSFHDFYSSCQILSEEKKLTQARLLLLLATRNVLKICLTLMGISAPEKM